MMHVEDTFKKDMMNEWTKTTPIYTPTTTLEQKIPKAKITIIKYKIYQNMDHRNILTKVQYSTKNSKIYKKIQTKSCTK